MTPKFTLIASIALLGFAAGAHAQESHKLKFSSVFPATHWSWERGGAKFAESVGELTGGRVSFDLFPAGQLGKEAARILDSGLAETAILVPSYEPAKLPLSSVAELPGFYDSSCEGTAKLWKLLKDDGPLYQAEYKPQGLVPLYVNVLPSFQLVTAKTRIEKLEDVAGLKLRANGTALTKTASELKAVAVTVTTTEFYDSLSRGTVDGGVYYMGSVKNVGLDGIIRYALDGAKLGGGATIYAISERAWDRLDGDTQQALREAGERTQQQLCAELDDLNRQIMDELVAAGKLTVTTVSGEERDRWLAALTPVAEAWAEQMESTRRPGNDLVEAFRAAAPTF